MASNSIQEKLALQEIPALAQVSRVNSIQSMSIHSRIREQRLRLGLTFEAVAARVGVKSWQTVQQWEIEGKGGTAPKRTRLPRVAEALETTPEYLMTGQGPSSRTWPFLAIDEEKVRGLAHDDLVRLETAVLAFADQFGLDVARHKKPSAA